MILQDSAFSMIGKGVRGDGRVVDGNHLRWFFKPEMGFPKYGFRLYRRDRRSWEHKRINIDFSNLSEEHYPPPFVVGGVSFVREPYVAVDSYDGCRGIGLKSTRLGGRIKRDTLDILFPEPAMDIKINLYSVGKAKVQVIACFADRPVRSSIFSLNPGNRLITLRADAVDKVRLVYMTTETASKCVLYKMGWIPVSVTDGGWVPIADLCLPVTHADYPCSHGAADDWAAARGRLDRHWRDRYGTDEPTFSQLHGYLEELVENGSTPQFYRTREEELTGTSMSEEAREPLRPLRTRLLQMLMTAGLDPGVAQMLGTYYVNLPIGEDPARGAVVGRYYDYKIEGFWTRIGKGGHYGSNAERRRDMADLPLSSLPLAMPAAQVEMDGFRFRSSQPMILEKYLGRKRLFIDTDLHVDLPAPMSMVHIKFKRTRTLPIHVHVFKGDGSSTIHTYDSLRTQSVTYRDHTRGIVGLMFYGHFRFYDLEYAHRDYAWICYNHAIRTRTAAPEPTGLKLYLLPGKTDPYSAASVGLKWKLPSPAAPQPDAAVFYEIQRLGIGKTEPERPGEISEDGFKSATKERPVLVARLPENTEGPPEFPPEWPKRTAAEKRDGIMPIFFIDPGNLKTDCWYAYRILGVDLFGCYSKSSAPGKWYDADNREQHPFSVRIRDLNPPPPPQAVTGKYLDPADPYLTKDEHDLARRGPGIAVAWRWPKALTEQAPDAHRFKVYFKPGRLNSLQGTVTEVTENSGSARKGLHIKKSIENFEASRNRVTMTLEDGEIGSLERGAVGRYFKYEGNFFPITNITLSGTRLRFVINHRAVIAARDTVAIETPGHGRGFRGTVSRVTSGRVVTIFLEREFEPKVLADADVPKILHCGGLWLKVTELNLYRWNRALGNGYVTLTVDNPVTIEPGQTGVFDVDVSRAEVRLEGEQVIGTNSMAGRRLRQMGKNFVIIRNNASRVSPGSAPGGGFSLVDVTLQNLTRSPREVPAAHQPASLSIAPSHPLFIDYGKPANWASGSWEGLTQKVDFSEGREAEEEMGGRDVAFLEYMCFILLESIPEAFRPVPTAETPMFPGNIAVTTVDRAGNESPVGQIQPIFTLLREKPPAPPVPDISEFVSTVPDYYGRSYFRVTWPVPDDRRPYFHQVYRGMDHGLMMVDLENHKDGHGETADRDLLQAIFGPGGVDRAPEIETDLHALDILIHEWDRAEPDQKQKPFALVQTAYTSLRADTRRYLGSLPENSGAFLPVSPNQDPADPGLWEGAQMVFKDKLEGKGRNRYFYRIAAMDKAGNISALSPSTPPVRVPDAFPPKAPVITKVLGGDRRVRLRWRRNTAAGMTFYRIFRCLDAADADDIRSMGEGPIAVLPADTPGMPLRVSVIKTRTAGESSEAAYLEAFFTPSAGSIAGVFLLDDAGEPVPGEEYFGGFVSLLLRVAVDYGNVFVCYRDTGGINRDTPAVTANGQVKIAVERDAPKIACINGVYREEDAARGTDVLEGIASGRIRLQTGEPVTLRNRSMAVDYEGIDGDAHTASAVPHELEYTDTELESGVYYYRVTAEREAVTTLVSPPSKIIEAVVFDNRPPEPPEWVSSDWIKLDDAGTVFPYGEEFEGAIPAITMAWGDIPEKFSLLLQKRERGSPFWNSVTPWLMGSTGYTDPKVYPDMAYDYRLKVKNQAGSMQAGDRREIEAVETDG